MNCVSREGNLVSIVPLHMLIIYQDLLYLFRVWPQGDNCVCTYNCLTQTEIENVGCLCGIQERQLLGFQ